MCLCVWGGSSAPTPSLPSQKTLTSHPVNALISSRPCGACRRTQSSPIPGRHTPSLLPNNPPRRPQTILAPSRPRHPEPGTHSSSHEAAPVHTKLFATKRRPFTQQSSLLALVQACGPPTRSPDPSVHRPSSFGPTIPPNLPCRPLLNTSPPKH